MEKIQYYPVRHSNALVALKAAFLFLFLSTSVFTEMQASELPKASSAHRAFEPILNKPNGLPEELIGCFPVLSTTAATGIGASSATTGGNITDDGGSSITARGVAYGTSPEPLIHTSSFTSDGTGIGAFTSQLTGLSPLTTYYVRAYATNSLGTSYGNEVSFTTSNPTIGSNYAGGIVFYVDATGQHGLVCAPSDQGEFAWGCQGAWISGTSYAFGTGMANTLAIVNGCSQRPIAASVCNDLVLNGYDDWYLPSLSELQLMYNNLKTQNLGNFPNHFWNLYWSSSESPPDWAEQVWFDINPTWPSSSFGASNLQWKNATGPVRAVRSFTTLSTAPAFTCGTSTVSDVDNNTYATVQIGTQCWTQSNLKVSKYRNGDNIPTGLDNSQWGSTTSGAYAIYNNDAANDALYGKLYNWYAVNDSRGLCPTGWHVPSDAEWTTLTTFLGGESVAGGKMKSTATQPTPGGWIVPNTGATNSSGFTGLPGGGRDSGGGFSSLGDFGFWWSSSDAGSGNAWYRNLGYDLAYADRNYYYHRAGFSVRCARD